MEGKELMIGDWVMLSDCKIPIRMEDVSGSSLFRRWADDGNICIPFSYSEIEPVPLTPEILEKNGFEKSDRWENYYVRKNAMVDEFGNVWNLLVLCDDLLFCELHIHIGNDPYDPDDSYCMPDFQFVHELQQKLRSNKLRTIADNLIL